MAGSGNAPPGDAARPPHEPRIVRHVRAKRADDRHACRIAAHAHQDGYAVPCMVMNLSAGGARLRFDALSARSVHDKPLVLDMPSIGRYPARFVWRAGECAGLAFDLAPAFRQSLKARLAARFGSDRATESGPDGARRVPLRRRFTSDG